MASSREIKALIINRELTPAMRSKLQSILPLPLIETEESDTYYPVNLHPDLQFHRICDTLIASSSVSDQIIDQIRGISDINIVKTNSRIGKTYPDNISLCAFSDHSILIHRIDRTDPGILSLAKDNDLRILHVKQGYSACTTLCVDDLYITNDRITEKSLINNGFPVLYLESGGIRLPSFDTGFIGGSMKYIEYGNRTFLLAFGNFDSYVFSGKIREFLKRNGRYHEIVSLSDEPLQDFGGIITL